MKTEHLQWKRDGEIKWYKKITISGSYNGKNLFVQNPFGKNGIGFCVTQVKVNGNTTTDEINATVFKIDLEMHKLKPTERFKLEIFYKDSSDTPRIMNPGAVIAYSPSGNGIMILEGKNCNANILATNPRSKNGTYGVKEVTVNGKTVENIASDVFEIPFYKMGISYEQKIKIEFKYENDCDPFILNPEMISW
jgi:hypothetical protein